MVCNNIHSITYSPTLWYLMIKSKMMKKKQMILPLLMRMGLMRNCLYIIWKSIYDWAVSVYACMYVLLHMAKLRQGTEKSYVKWHMPHLWSEPQTSQEPSDFCLLLS